MSLQHSENTSDTNVPCLSKDVTLDSPLQSGIDQSTVHKTWSQNSTPVKMEEFLETPPGFSPAGEQGNASRPRNDDSENEEVRDEPQHQKLCVRGHWRPQEDAKLKELVAQYGPQHWNTIADKIEGRSGKSCRLRWYNQLDPRINRRGFTDEEEEKLLSAHKLYGNKWSTIAKLLAGRTDNAVKNHFHVMMCRMHREKNMVYRRKPVTYPPPPSPQPQEANNGVPIPANPGNNTCSDSTNSGNNIAESAGTGSTCTDLTLSPSSIKVPHFLNKSSPLHPQKKQKQNMLELKLGLPSSGEEKAIAIMGTSVNIPGNGDLGSKSDGDVIMVDQPTGSNSASESVANKKANPQMYGGSQKRNVAFIDFLGVGAT